MGNLSNNKKSILLKIEKARLLLSIDLQNNVVTEEDILGLINKNEEYLLEKRKPKNYKELVLRRIYNSPFLLCDQNISINLKKILPLFLHARFNMEKEHITYNYNHGYITKKEYLEEIDEFEFIYYKSSMDGRSILKTGKAIGIKKEIMKIK